MNDNWYYSKNGQQLGPFGLGQLKQLADAGMLSPSDLVWQEGYKEWMAAGSVSELFPVVNVAAAPSARPSAMPPPIPPIIPPVSVQPPPPPVALPRHRGMVNCPKCKKQVADTAESCPHCGAPQAAKERNELMGCLSAACFLATMYVFYEYTPIVKLPFLLGYGIIFIVSLLVTGLIYAAGKYISDLTDRL